MKTSVFSLSAALLLSGALVGCGTNNAANRNHAGMRPVGYYNGQGNNGPGYNNRANYPNNHAGMGNNFGAGAGNYNGTAYNNRNNTRGNTSVNKNQASAISRKINNMNHVQNAHVVVTNNDVLVGVKSNTKVTGSMKKNIRNVVNSIARGKNIHVTADPSMYKRISNVSTNLQNGNAGNEASSDVRGIINDLANAVKRPFQNNVKNR